MRRSAPLLIGPLIGLLLATTAVLASPPVPLAGAPKSVLFLVIDDFRPELSTAYGQRGIVTPNLDKFAQSALTFGHAYVQFAHCSPSRNSFLSGRSPQTTQVYNFVEHFREVGQNWTALPQFFKENGFYTAGGGKVYHPNLPPNNDPPSWDEYFFANGDDRGCKQGDSLFDKVCPSDEDDSAFYDCNLVAETVAQLKKAKAQAKPFFIAAGLRRPHLAFHAPRRFYDMYANNGTFPDDMPLAKHKKGPVGMPELAFYSDTGPGVHPWPSVPWNYTSPVPDHIAALARWGYYASVSFMDSNVGIVLDALDDLQLAEDTVVVFMGDHGWQLGEHGEWGKHTNFELALRVPLMVRSPAHPKSAGARAPHFVESLDLYRTLAGLVLPGATVEAGVEGTDLSPIFEDPTAMLETAAFSQMSRCPQNNSWINNPCNFVPLKQITYMGYTVRVTGWRYTVWLAFNGTTNRALWDGPMHGEELYDHTGDGGADFDAFENANAVNASGNQLIRNKLLAALRTRFDTPPGNKTMSLVAGHAPPPSAAATS